MDLESQFKVLFYSFIYGILFVSTYKLLRMIKFKKKFLKYLSELFFCLLHLSLFYFLLYKLNYGMLSIYIFLFLILGGLFCHSFYFGDKKR